MHDITLTTTIDELRAHAADPETPTLPFTPERIALYESGGYVVDLTTGQRFRPADDWHDLASRWAEHRRHTGQPLDPNALADALIRAAGSPGETIYEDYVEFATLAIQDYVRSWPVG